MKRLLWIALIFAGRGAFAQLKGLDNPLVSLKKTHPRIIIDSFGEITNLKKSNDPFIIQGLKISEIRAKKILEEPASKYELISDQGGKLLTVSRTVLRRVTQLAFQFRLSGDTAYARRAWEELKSASNFPDWNSRHFLDDAEMCFAFAIGYDWLFDYWNADQKKIIKQSLIDKGLLRGMLGYEGLETDFVSDWKKSRSNWNQVCNGGLAIAALAVADEEPKLSSYILRQAVSRLPNVMEILEPDGANDEGPGYWVYGMQYNVALLTSLNSALGTDFGLSEIKGFSKTGDYFLAMGLSNGRTFNYADDWLDTVHSPELLWLDRRFNRPLYTDYQIRHSGYTPLELLWYQPIAGKIEQLPLNSYFRKAEVATIRSSWDDPNGWFIGFKGGSNRANHGHLDIGNFVLDWNGQRWFCDLAHDAYGLPGYFDNTPGGQRWRYYRMKAEGHNTIVIDPDASPDQSVDASAAITKFKTDKTETWATIDMTSAYPGKVSSAIRGIGLFNNNQVIVRDEIKGKNVLKDVYWFAQTKATVQLTDAGKTALLHLGNKVLKAQILLPAKAKFEITAPRQLVTALHDDLEDKNEGLSRLTIHLSNVSSTTITVSFSDPGRPVKPQLQPLASWK